MQKDPIIPSAPAPRVNHLSTSSNPLGCIADVARRYLGLREVSRNRAPWLAEFWRFTDYREGMENREPWCAAAVCAWVQIADRENQRFHLPFPPRSAAVRGIEEWAREKGHRIVPVDIPQLKPQRGWLLSFRPKLSHIGVLDMVLGQGVVSTIEGNTGADGGREGDGVYQKVRKLADFPGARWIVINPSAYTL